MGYLEKGIVELAIDRVDYGKRHTTFRDHNLSVIAIVHLGPGQTPDFA